jgi:hypothetical protein
MRLFLLALPLLGCLSQPTPRVAAANECSTALKPVEVRELVGQWKTENHKFAFTRVVGAEAVVAAQPAMSREWVERTARCRIPDAEVRVTSVDGGYAVQLTSKDPDVARTLVARAQQL